MEISLHAGPRVIGVCAIAKEPCTRSTTARLLPPCASGTFAPPGCFAGASGPCPLGSPAEKVEGSLHHFSRRGRGQTCFLLDLGKTCTFRDFMHSACPPALWACLGKGRRRGSSEHPVLSQVHDPITLTQAHRVHRRLNEAELLPVDLDVELGELVDHAGKGGHSKFPLHLRGRPKKQRDETKCATSPFSVPRVVRSARFLPRAHRPPADPIPL
jgi:hypothetical protein